MSIANSHKLQGRLEVRLMLFCRLMWAVKHSQADWQQALEPHMSRPVRTGCSHSTTFMGYCHCCLLLEPSLAPNATC